MTYKEWKMRVLYQAAELVMYVDGSPGWSRHHAELRKLMCRHDGYRQRYVTEYRADHDA